MIPSQTFETYAPFGDNATKVQPDSAKYSAGFQQADVLPAEWMNWAWNKNTKGITDLNEGLSSVEAEINSVLSAYGITPDKTKTDQLKTALAKIPPQITTCSTAAATAAKSIAISGSSLRAGNVYAIEMTYGNTAASPTLSINSGTAYPLCDCKGSALGSGAWQAGEIITVLFTGTKYLMASNPVNEIANNNPYPVTSGAVSCLIASGTTLTGPRLGVGGVIKVMFTQDINLATAADVLELTYNSIVYPVKVCKNGALADVGIHEIASGTYSCIQAYTTIELVFNGSVFVIVGNPVLLSGSDYTIYSDGKIEYTQVDSVSDGVLKPVTSNAVYDFVSDAESYSTSEVKTNKTWIDGKPIYRKCWIGLNIELEYDVWINTSVPNSNYSSIVNVCAWNDKGTCWKIFANRDVGNYVQLLSTRYSRLVVNKLMLEYTKTTD